MRQNVGVEFNHRPSTQLLDPRFNSKLIFGRSTGQDFDFFFEQLPPFPTTRRVSTRAFAAPKFFSVSLIPTGPGQQLQLGDFVQDRRKQILRGRHLGHLEGDILRVPHHLGPDLDQLLAQCGQRPVFNLPGQGQRAQKIAKIVGQGNSCSRTSLSRKSWQDNRVQFSAILPSLIHCSAVPRLL